ncbi:MAG TPA: TIGR00159 family protein [Verrucomicrobiales bacterium]|nr:TIGR00159 family protein [Verrucomicrobiales bacterium]
MWEQIGSYWRPVVEIMILAVAIYYALMFVRGTRGWPVVIGFGAVVLLTYATTLLGLEVLSHLLKTFFAFSAVVLLIIFQPEVRRLLAELGNQRLFNTTQRERQNIEVIVETAERLADVRIGALIALEQSISLSEAVESGVPVNCTATPEMLETIFFPNNAVHDGGVIIDEGRIIKAACIFPLTQRQDLQKSMGTRHRAALGLSEETDAVVVVVSEETGAISYAYKGVLKRGLTVEELRSFLTSIFIIEKQSKSPFSWFKRKPREEASVETAAAKSEANPS